LILRFLQFGSGWGKRRKNLTGLYHAHSRSCFYQPLSVAIAAATRAPFPGRRAPVSGNHRSGHCSRTPGQTSQVKHLALHKAKSLIERFPDALIIGADQVFVSGRGRVLGKPGSPEKAIAQLAEMSGRVHTFYTGVTIFDSRSGETLTDVVTFTVAMRRLGREQIKRYVERENPVDCAGSFKIERLGIALMERMEGDDYTALIGLPLIRLTEMLAHFGVEVI